MSLKLYHKHLPVRDLIPNDNIDSYELIWDSDFKEDPENKRAYLKNLYESIKEKGIKEPIGVHHKDGKFLIRGGCSRWFCAKKLGFEKIKCIIVDYDEDLDYDTPIKMDEIPKYFNHAVNYFEDTTGLVIQSSHFHMLDEQEWNFYYYDMPIDDLIPTDVNVKDYEDIWQKHISKGNDGYDDIVNYTDDEKKKNHVYLWRLFKSIEKEGLKDPICVNTKDDGKFYITGGCSRWFVAKKLGHKTIKSIVCDKENKFNGGKRIGVDDLQDYYGCKVKLEEGDIFRIATPDYHMEGDLQIFYDKINPGLLHNDLDLWKKYEADINNGDVGLRNMRESIRKDGISEPLNIKWIDGRYEVYGGLTRWSCAMMLGIKKVPCIITNCSNLECNKNKVLGKPIEVKDISNYYSHKIWINEWDGKLFEIFTSQFQQRKTLGVFIPGRLESERLPNKLLLPLGDTNLWEIACKKLKQLKGVDTYVLVADKKLVEIAEKEGIKVILRTEETCKIDGPMTKIFAGLELCENDYLMFLNPCLYNLSVETIQRCIDEFMNSTKYCATSVKKYQNWLWNEKTINITPIDYKTLSTKEIPEHYEAGHCFHIFKKDKFFESGDMLDEHLQLIELPKEECLDVDDKTDYEVAKCLYT